MPFDAQARPANPTKRLARKLGYSPRDDGKLADFLHDEASRCSNCAQWVCHADLADDVEPAQCRACRWNLVPRAA